jgi:hypothetical protein
MPLLEVVNGVRFNAIFLCQFRGVEVISGQVPD